MAKAKIFAGCVRNQSDAMFFWICVLIGMVELLACYDVSQRKHAILMNFSVFGHMRYLLESIVPELRQYIVARNDEGSHSTRASLKQRSDA